MEKEKRKIQDIIAERIFDTETETKQQIKLIIGRPYKKEESFICEFQILGVRSEKVKEAQGEDAIQALIIAMQMASALLYTSELGKEGKINWLGGMGRDPLGLPVADVFLDLVGLKLLD